ncbi:hypothetical protein [Euzebya sp.]|uniref:hypothetical protein n=1 Tax=Euzebya sp. TaxID=1971409 RepID=UPI0035126C17
MSAGWDPNATDRIAPELLGTHAAPPQPAPPQPAPPQPTGRPSPSDPVLDRFPRRQGGEVLVYQQGFVDVLADGSARSIGWDEVGDFRGVSTRSRVTVAFVPIAQTTSHRFEIGMVTGGTVVLDRSVDRVQELADALERATARHRLRHRLADIQQTGRTVLSDRFPAITITSQAVFERDRLQFVHSAVEAFDPANGGVRIAYRDERGRRRFLHLPAEKLDVRTALRLIEGLR